ncbi:MAG: thioredoxin domain-containing protein [Hyphomicrobiales bacterium]|nr:thioredoxin domain-containing protein [Hyphomicrobiales bacterium]
MNYAVRFTYTILLISLSALLLPAPASALDDSDKPQIEKIIREYLLKNPEILQEMQQLFEARQQALQVAKQQETIKQKAQAIFDSKYQVEIGNPDAKYKVVEFFDYNCPYCQRAMLDMEKILKGNPDVKFVIKEWPVLGQQSYEAHNVSIAFSKLMPEKYYEFHQQLLGMKGRKGEKKAIELALRFGLDEQLLRAEMKKPYVLEALQENNSIANDLGITGTPSYVIGNEVVFGAVGVTKLMSHIAAMKN